MRGPASGVLPAGTYFITIEGDGESGNLGQVQEVLDLSGLSFGSNGYLTISWDSDLLTAGTQNSYQTALGLAASNDYDQTTVTGYDGDLIDYTATYMLISAPASPSGVNVDSSPLDGEFDAAGAHTLWNIYDSVSSMDDDGAGANSEYAWAQMNITTNYDNTPSYFAFPSGSSVISLNDGTSGANVYYIARQGTSTGYDPNSDWMAGQTNSGSTRPNWTFTGDLPRVHPDALASTSLPDSTFGGPNEDPANDVLSTDDFLLSAFKIYPNPASNYILIESKKAPVSGIEIFNVLGKSVSSHIELVDNKVDISGLSNGMYFLKINSDGQSITKKIIKE